MNSIEAAGELKCVTIQRPHCTKRTLNIRFDKTTAVILLHLYPRICPSPCCCQDEPDSSALALSFCVSFEVVWRLTDCKSTWIDLSDICPIPWIDLAPVDMSSACMITPVVETIIWRLSSFACTFVNLLYVLGGLTSRSDSSLEVGTIPVSKSGSALVREYVILLWSLEERTLGKGGWKNHLSCLHLGSTSLPQANGWGSLAFMRYKLRAGFPGRTRLEISAQEHIN